MARKLFWLFVTNNFLRPQSLRNATAPRSRAAAFNSSVEGKGVTPFSTYLRHAGANRRRITAALDAKIRASRG